MKAKLQEFKGNFEAEHTLWKQIYQIDPNDKEAHRFFQLRQLEAQEHHYFTDIMPEGTHKMLTYQRPLLKPMALGFLGSLAFIAFTHYAENTLPALLNPAVLFSAFFAFVTMPLVLVIYKFLTTMYCVSMNKDSVCVSTRLKNYEIPWQNMEKIELIYDGPIMEPHLSLKFTPKDAEQKSIEIDLSKSSTSIRSVAIFLRELKFHYSELEPISGRENKNGRSTVRF